MKRLPNFLPKSMLLHINLLNDWKILFFKPFLLSSCKMRWYIHEKWKKNEYLGFKIDLKAIKILGFVKIYISNSTIIFTLLLSILLSVFPTTHSPFQLSELRSSRGRSGCWVAARFAAAAAAAATNKCATLRQHGKHHAAERCKMTDFRPVTFISGI